MTDKINRRGEIIRVASQLFIKNGYEATSVRDIAAGVGCTEAALYYHFKNGKRAILKEVVEVLVPMLFNVIVECREAASLEALVAQYSRLLQEVMSDQAEVLRWAVSEFPNFGEEERAFFYEKQSMVFSHFVEMIQRYVPDRAEAQQTVWIIICISIGYIQMFYSFNVKSTPYGQQVHLGTLLSRALSLAPP